MAVSSTWVHAPVTRPIPAADGWIASAAHQDGYGVGDLGGNLFFTIMAFWLLNFVTDTLGLAASLAGLALLLGRALDAVTDPLMGIRADVNEIAGDHEADVAYLDPPYNERQYIDCYHVLDNIATWNKPELHGKTRKFEREALKSRYSRRRTALEAFAQLIDRIRARYIVVSYSNEGLLSVDDLKETLETRGPTTIESTDYGVFGNGAGKSVRRRVVEHLAICRVDA